MVVVQNPRPDRICVHSESTPFKLDPKKNVYRFEAPSRKSNNSWRNVVLHPHLCSASHMTMSPRKINGAQP